MQGQDLDSMILVVPFQLRIVYNSMNLFGNSSINSDLTEALN